MAGAIVMEDQSQLRWQSQPLSKRPDGELPRWRTRLDR